MAQLGKTTSVIDHLYPGIVITLGFVTITPVLIKRGYPPQLSLLICVLAIAIPILLAHLHFAKKREGADSIWALNEYRNKLPTGKLMLYALGLVIFAFITWGLTQPLNEIITSKLLYWLPAWYTVQDFSGYSKEVIEFTLVLNLVINGLIAPVVEELYFRGYLLPRMQAWGKWAFVVNALLFSLYHFWQPYIYLTLLISLLPMTYLVWKTKDLRLGILTHCLLNVTGALLSFALLLKK
jgi:membrane protease YdiL (CAAX protease family)